MNVRKPTAIQRAALPAFLFPALDTAAHDVFIQSQTGPGKTLSFLLSIIQDLLPLSLHRSIHRDIGGHNCAYPGYEEDETGESDNLTRLTRWLVNWGPTRTHEKAKLRKGVPILVSSPGRSLHHLQNISSFNVSIAGWFLTRLISSWILVLKRPSKTSFKVRMAGDDL